MLYDYQKFETSSLQVAHNDVPYKRTVDGTFTLCEFVDNVTRELENSGNALQEYTLVNGTAWRISKSKTGFTYKHDVGNVLKYLFNVTYNMYACKYFDELLERHNVSIVFHCRAVKNGHFECISFAVISNAKTNSISLLDSEDTVLRNISKNEASVASKTKLELHLKYLHIIPGQKLVMSRLSKDESLIFENEKFIQDFIYSKDSRLKKKKTLGVKSPPPDADEMFRFFLLGPVLLIEEVLCLIPTLFMLLDDSLYAFFSLIQRISDYHYFVKLLNSCDSEHYKKFIEKEVKNHQLCIKLYYGKDLFGKNYCRKFTLCRLDQTKSEASISKTAPASATLSLQDEMKIHTLVTFLNYEIAKNSHFMSECEFVFKKKSFLNFGANKVSLWARDSKCKDSFLSRTDISSSLFDDLFSMLDCNSVGDYISSENRRILDETASNFNLVISVYDLEKEICVRLYKV